MPMDFVNIDAIGASERIQHFLLSTFATLMNGFPPMWVSGGGNSQVCVVNMFCCPCCLCLCHFNESVVLRNKMISLGFGKLAQRVAC